MRLQYTSTSIPGGNQACLAPPTYACASACVFVLLLLSCTWMDGDEVEVECDKRKGRLLMINTNGARCLRHPSLEVLLRHILCRVCQHREQRNWAHSPRGEKGRIFCKVVTRTRSCKITRLRLLPMLFVTKKRYRRQT